MSDGASVTGTTSFPLAHRAALTDAELDRAIGAFVGAAVGDALGARYEFGPAGAFSAEFPDAPADGGTEMIGGGSFGWAPGEFTDDTQMAIVLAESLLDRGHLDLDDLFARFRVWASTARDVGVGTALSLRHATRHEATTEAARSGRQSAGNGALMRVTPIALAFLDADTTTVMGAAVAQATTTHHDPAAGWGAAIHAELVRRTILGTEPFHAIDDVVTQLPEPHRTTFGDVLAPTFDPRSFSGPSNGTVWTCLGQSVWANRRGDSHEDVVRLSIDLGADTDTVAAVAGGLAGARFGRTALPDRWTSVLNGVVTDAIADHRYDRGRLEHLAVRLLTG